MRPPKTAARVRASIWDAVKPALIRLRVCSALPAAVEPAKKYFVPSKGCGVAACVVPPIWTDQEVTPDSKEGFASRFWYDGGRISGESISGEPASMVGL